MSINPLSGPPTTIARAPVTKKREIHGLVFESVVMEVRLDMILVDHSYQHQLKQTKVRKIAKNFHVRQFGIPVVNKRANGYHYLLDGGHRVAAVNLLEDQPVTIRCEVFTGLTHEEEAWLAHELNDTRDDWTPMELFIAGVDALHPEEMAIDAAVHAAGMVVARRSGPNNIQSVASLFQVYRRFGGPMLTRVLSIMHAAWPAENDPCHHLLITGMPFLLDKEKEIDEKRLIHVLALATPSVVVGRLRILRASMSSSTAKAAVTILTGMYNHGLRSGTRLGGDEDR